MLGMPYEHAMCYVLEQIYNKAKYGNGGTNMYASSSYATKTWFIADRRRDEHNISCMNFMEWLKDMGVRRVGRIHMSPYRLTRVKELLDDYLAELNAHADWVFFEYFGLDRDKMGGNYVADKVGDLW
jgi:hypothetical protein